MTEPEQIKNKVDKHDEENLKGTFVLVFVVGGVILAMWFIVFYHYVKLTF